MSQQGFHLISDDMYLVRGIMEALSGRYEIKWHVWDFALKFEGLVDFKMVLDLNSLMNRSLSKTLINQLMLDSNGDGHNFCMLVQNEVQACFHQSTFNKVSIVSLGMTTDYLEYFFKVFINGEKTAGFSTSSSITKREHEVLSMILEGYKAKDIADLMGLSYKTIATHKILAYRKLGCKSTQQFFKLVQPFLENHLMTRNTANGDLNKYHTISDRIQKLRTLKTQLKRGVN